MKNLLKLPALILVLFAFGCESPDAWRKIDRPFGNIPVNGTADSFEAAEGATLNQQTGTVITIPKNAFVTENGTPYNGKVVLSFDEFHSPAEIISSGIPMFYQDGKESGFFTSAGMFSIDFRTPENQKLNLGEGKSVGIDLASDVSDEQYNFYRFEEEKPTPSAASASLIQVTTMNTLASNPLAGRWRMLSRAPKPLENPKIKELEETLQQLPNEPVMPEQMMEDAYKFELDANLRKYPELKGFKGIIWQYDGDGTADSDPSQNAWINDHPWNDIKIERERDAFFIQLVSDTKSFKTKVKPVFSPVDLLQASRNYDHLMEEYAQTRAKKIQFFNRKQMMKKYSRALSVSAPGIYNCDILPQIMASNLEVDANFSNLKSTLPKAFYVITRLTGEGRYVTLKYDYSSSKVLTVNSTCSNIIVMIYPDKSVSTCSDEQLKEAINNRKKGLPVTLELTNKEGFVTSSNDLDAVIKTMI